MEMEMIILPIRNVASPPLQPHPLSLADWGGDPQDCWQAQPQVSLQQTKLLGSLALASVRFPGPGTEVPFSGSWLPSLKGMYLAMALKFLGPDRKITSSKSEVLWCYALATSFPLLAVRFFFKRESLCFCTEVALPWQWGLWSLYLQQPWLPASPALLIPPCSLCIYYRL